MSKWILFGAGIGTLMYLFRATRKARPFTLRNSNQELDHRIKLAIRNVIANPGAITVRVRGDVVSLSGPIFTSEVSRLLERVRSVPGVKEIENNLEAHETANGVPGLQGRRHPFGEAPQATI